MSDDYEVGYGKPPRHTQFKKGQSGNPRGRPKGSRNFSTDLKNTLKERVRVTKGDRAKTVSTQLAVLMRLREKALGGDARALDRYIELARTYNDEELTEARVQLSETDEEVMDTFTARLLRRAQKSSPVERGDAQIEDDDDAWLR